MIQVIIYQYNPLISDFKKTVGVFNTNYINYDFFICAVAMEFDLKDFKRICQNSLECSLLNPEEKENALQVWGKQWDKFIQEFNK